MENLQKAKEQVQSEGINRERKVLLIDLCLYTVFYSMAYLLKGRGYAVLSFFCFSCLAIYLFLRERNREKSTLTLTGLYALGLLFGEGVATLQLSKLSSPWTVNTWLSFYLSYFSFFVFYHGEILFYPIFSFFISRRQKEKHQIAV